MKRGYAHGMGTVRALDRGIQVLLKLSMAGSLGLAELHHETLIPKPTLLRILRTLEARGMVWRRLADGRYCPTHHLAHRPRHAAQTERLARAAAPVLDALCARILWPSDLAVPQGDCMEICETNRPLAPVALHRDLVGLRISMLHSAHGRAYLAFCEDAKREALLARLRRSRRRGNEQARNRAWVDRMIEETRALGYAARDPAYGSHFYKTARQQDDGLLAIAVPVFGGPEVVGTVNMLWAARLATVAHMARRHLVDLRAAAQRIGERFNLA